MKSLRCAASLLLAAATCAQVRLSPPIVTLEIESLAGFADTRLVSEFVRVTEDGAPVPEMLRQGLGFLREGFAGVSLPLEMHALAMTGQAGVALLAVRDPRGSWSEAVRERVRALIAYGGRNRPANPSGATEDLVWSLGRIGPGSLPPGEGVAEAAREVLAAPRRDSLRDLSAVIAACPVRLVLDWRALMRALPADVRQPLAVLPLLFGPRMAGMVFGVRAEGEHVVTEGVFDFGAETGLLGRLFRTPARIPPLLAYADGAGIEFSVFDLSIEGIGELLDLARTFGAEDIDRELIDGVTRHFDGQVLILSRPSTAEQAVDPDSDEPVVVVLGTSDGDAARGAMQPLLDGFELELTKTPDADGLRFVLAYGEPIFATATTADALVVLGADEASRALWKQAKARAEGSVIDQLPPAFAQGASILGRTSPLSELSGRVAMQDLRGELRDREGLAAVLARMQLHSSLVAVRVEAEQTRFWSRQ